MQRHKDPDEDHQTPCQYFVGWDGLLIVLLLAFVIAFNHFINTRALICCCCYCPLQLKSKTDHQQAD
jgi:hypothetical protein